MRPIVVHAGTHSQGVCRMCTRNRLTKTSSRQVSNLITLVEPLVRIHTTHDYRAGCYDGVVEDWPAGNLSLNTHGWRRNRRPKLNQKTFSGHNRGTDNIGTDVQHPWIRNLGRSDWRPTSWKFVPQTHGRRRNLRPKLIQKTFSRRDQASGCRWYGCTTPMKTHKSFQSIGKRGRSDGRLTSWKFVPQTHRQRRNLRPDWNQKTFSQRDQASGRLWCGCTTPMIIVSFVSILTHMLGRRDWRLTTWKFVPQTHGWRRNLRPKLIQKTFSRRDQATDGVGTDVQHPWLSSKWSFIVFRNLGRSDWRPTSWKFVPQTRGWRRNLRPE